MDVLFANAGIMPGSSMSELKVSDWMAMVDINVKGVLNAMAAVLPEFTAQKRGHIVVTSSMAGTRSVPGNAVYCGTKHFVRAMLDSFRMESIQEGTHIRTTAIYPGAIRTELLNTIAPSETKTMVEEFYKMWVWSRRSSPMQCVRHLPARQRGRLRPWACGRAWRADKL